MTIGNAHPSLYQYDHRKKINTLSYLGNPTPTHMGATHASSKIDHKFQNRIPRELDETFESFPIFEIERTST